MGFGVLAGVVTVERLDIIDGQKKIKRYRDEITKTNQIKTPLVNSN